MPLWGSTKERRRRNYSTLYTLHFKLYTPLRGPTLHRSFAMRSFYYDYLTKKSAN